jgi:hypothetical protein
MGGADEGAQDTPPPPAPTDLHHPGNLRPTSASPKRYLRLSNGSFRTFISLKKLSIKTALPQRVFSSASKNDVLGATDEPKRVCDIRRVLFPADHVAATHWDELRAQASQSVSQGVADGAQ